MDAITEAVFANSITQVDEILAANRIIGDFDVRDHHGNTPLQLAVKLGHIDLAIVLINYGFQFSVCDKTNVGLLGDAMATKNRRLLRVILNSIRKRIWSGWVSTKVLSRLKVGNDCFVKLKWSIASASIFGSLFNAMNLQDTCHVWKRRSWLRIDGTVDGVGGPFGLSLSRSDLSLILVGEDGNTPGDLLLFDHCKKTVKKPLVKLSSPTVLQQEQEIEKLLHTGRDMFTGLSVSFTDFRVTNRQGDSYSDSALGLLSEWTAEVNVLVSRRNRDSTATKPELESVESYLSTRPVASDGDVWHWTRKVEVALTVSRTTGLSRQLVPVLEVLEMRDSRVAQLRDLLLQCIAALPEDTFPVKIVAPLFPLLGITATLSFEDIQVEVPDEGESGYCALFDMLTHGYRLVE